MIIGPKYKICKRLGSSVFEKCQTQKFQLAEARAPRKTKGRRGGASDFGAQLLEKQKARFTYGLSESQFSRYVHEAMESKGAAAGLLLNRLEARLDNVVYRAGFVKTRRAARQLVGHGHVHVNGRRLNVPSYKAEVGDVVSIRTESRPSALFANRTDVMAETKAPAWIQFEDNGFAAKIAAVPGVEETSAPFSAATIIQFYSR
ncbi:MAG: 30S ribosomal protein S4 [Candidatus Pacebacteria bacterium]|nr:30S ribosomal protein S4 [Candidatus Paceibacterota bacterium]